MGRVGQLFGTIENDTPFEGGDDWFFGEQKPFCVHVDVFVKKNYSLVFWFEGPTPGVGKIFYDGDHLHPTAKKKPASCTTPRLLPFAKKYAMNTTTQSNHERKRGPHATLE